MFEQRDRGAAAVEFALILTLLLTLFVSIIEGGRLFVTQAQLASSAREAARELAIGTPPATAYSRADEVFTMGSPVIDTFAGCPTPPVAGTRARVVLTYEVSSMTGFIPFTINLRGNGVMRCGG